MSLTARFFVPCIYFVLLVQMLRAGDAVANIAPYDLNKTQLQQLEKKAKAGNKEACMRVASYYSLIRDDEKTAAQWWAKLAETGDVDGVYGYGTSLMNLGDFSTAKKWLLQAKEMRHPYANGALKRLGELSARVPAPTKP